MKYFNAIISNELLMKSDIYFSLIIFQKKDPNYSGPKPTQVTDRDKLHQYDRLDQAECWWNHV